MEFNKPDFEKILASVFGEDMKIEFEIVGDVITLNGDEETKPMIIGKNGRNINSLRELVKIYNKLHSTNFNLEVA